MHRNAADDAADVARQARRERVALLRVQGTTWQAIANELGVNIKTVIEDFDRLMAAAPAPTAARVREEENARLERERERLDVLTRVVQRRLFETKKDANGNVVPVLDLTASLDCIRAIARVSEKLIAVSAGRRKLYGADAPEQREVGGLGGGPILVTQGTSTLSELMAIVEHNRKSPA